MEPKLSFREKLVSLLKPSLPEVVIGISIVVVLLLAGAISAYLEHFPLIADLRTNFNALTQDIGEALDTQFVTNLVSLFFWALVGLSVYSLLWILFVVIIDLRNDIVVSEYFLHPRSLHKADYWVATLSRRVIVLTGYIFIGLYVILLLWSLPIMYESTRNLFLQETSTLFGAAVYCLLALGSWLLGWHLVLIVRRFSISLTKEV